MVEIENTKWLPLFPKQIDNSFGGFKITLYFFYVLIAMTIARSLIHMFFPDGGAWSIASIDISVEGGSNIIGMFAQWGLSQLLFGILYLIVSIKYKSLVPLMYGFIFVEYTMRLVMGLLKPLETAQVAPGAIGNFIIIPLSIVLFIFSLRVSNK